MRPIIIGIAGGSGSGKTTVALRVAGQFTNRRVVILHHDSYYVDRPDAIAPKWMVSFNVTPVVKNIFADW